MNPTVDDEADDGATTRNEKGKSYEEWRASHPERRVDVDIRAAAAVLREKYAVSSIAVWGTCFGGGRALEAAAGWYAGGASSYYEDAFSDRRAPPHVDPIACISWYPTRYDANKLFGKKNEGFRTFESGEDRKVAVMAVFAENDDLPGATPEDAALLRSCLEDDPRVVDFMVKVFPGQKHGFAHANLGQQEEGGDDADRFVDEGFGSVDSITTGGDAEVACLLSTAWMETYTRVFLPTVGTPVRDDEENSWRTLEMNSQAGQREIRKELEDAIAKFEDVTPDFSRMSQSRSPLLDGEANEVYDRIEEERERIKQEILTKYGITPDDDDETFNSKFAKAMADGALDRLLIDAYVDDSGDAYW
jgi:dienelactone hydrolase